MKAKKTLLAMAASLSLISGATYAAGPTPPPSITVQGGTIHFDGSLVNAPCSVNVNSEDQTVHLGQYRTSEFTATGTASRAKNFNIVLEDCDASVYHNAAVAFTGQRDKVNDGLLAVTSNANKTAAGNVGIQILDEKSIPVVLDGSKFSTPHTLLNGENVLPFSARYVSTADKTTAGDADADAVFTMQYN
ncbi:type 1 fimbrial major subunit FimA [Klebsiella aerogenes]|uniref:type 1 fimbrial major subunit FimA n=1 Tax=Klebsiella aerogenes TaxID=548 RepID=UPI003D31A874